jgi:uncharacterized protein YndB with AHSA1/START domain
MERIQVSREIDAPPEAVYAAIADVTRMGEWSEECYGCEWHEGFEGPVIGAVFDGHNRTADHEWTTQGTVTEADPGRRFAFECSMYGVPYSTWAYQIEPTAGDCSVTEWTEDFRTEEALEFARKISGVDDRADRSRSAERNRRAMSKTLELLADALRHWGAPTG